MNLWCFRRLHGSVVLVQVDPICMCCNFCTFWWYYYFFNVVVVVWWRSKLFFFFTLLIFNVIWNLFHFFFFCFGVMRSFFFHFILFRTFFNVPIKKARIFDGFGVCMHLFFMCKMSPIWICCYFDDSIFFSLFSFLFSMMSVDFCVILFILGTFLPTQWRRYECLMCCLHASVLVVQDEPNLDFAMSLLHLSMKISLLFQRCCWCMMKI